MANAITPIFGGSYDGRPEANKEDILDLISNIDPIENSLLSGLGRTSAHDIVHITLTDVLDTPASNARVEGVDFSGRALVQPARVLNYTQIIGKEFAVSGTEQAVSHYGFNDRLSYEKDKAMTAWGNDAEFALMRAALVCGVSGTARQMNGVKAAITTVTSNHSGVSLSETMFNDKFQAVYTNTGGKIDEVYVGPNLKRRISGFTAGTTKFTQADTRGLVNAVDVYEGDFGRHKLMLHRFVTVAGTDTNEDFIGLQTPLWKIAVLQGREPKFVDLAPAGDSVRGMILGEMTIEARNQKGNFKGTNVA